MAEPRIHTFYLLIVEQRRGACFIDVQCVRFTVLAETQDKVAPSLQLFPFSITVQLDGEEWRKAVLPRPSKPSVHVICVLTIDKPHPSDNVGKVFGKVSSK